MLVHAHGNANVVLARADAVCGHFQRRGGGGAAIVHVHEGNAGTPQQAQHRVGIVDLAAAAERELDIFPGDAAICQRQPDGISAHFNCRLRPETPERVQAHTQNDYIAHSNLLKRA